MIKTETIFNELKKSVFGQDEYLRKLAITGYKHQLKQKLIQKGEKPINSNLLVIGPSGSGKTFAVKKLSKLLDIPFYEIDCSNIVQTGYRGGEDITSALASMVNTLGISKAERSIVYLDEFDKILDLALIADGKGKGPQQNFLKYLEPNIQTIYNKNTTRSSDRLNTAGITFIATGSFEMAKEKIGKTNLNKMGFNINEKKESGVQLNEEDLIKSGYMPELIGRFGSIININQLSEDDFYNILKYGNSSDLEIYKTAFNEQGVDVTIDDEVYKEIARRAFNTATGARNIGNTLNTILDKCLSDISNNETIRSINITFKDGEIKSDYNNISHKERINRLIKMLDK